MISGYISFHHFDENIAFTKFRKTCIFWKMVKIRSFDKISIYPTREKSQKIT